ncbi:MAG: Rieske (2Fe-2S) protein [bacterium]|nr:Rieske (2Fe-2S) protein [bacterium]
MAVTTTDFVPCAHVDDIPEGSIIAVNVEGHSIALANTEGTIRAVDNRCPHMGYPLNQGTIHNGIIICHWHHARFDLASGCTFDAFADDVRPYPVEIHDGQVYVNVHSNGRDPVAHWKRRLSESLEQNINLVIAKSVISLRSNQVNGDDIAEIGTRYGAYRRQQGWGPALTILTCMANVVPKLSDPDKILALYQGLLHVARDTAGASPRIVFTPLETEDLTLKRIKEWFRYLIEVRNADGAERALLTAIQMDATPCDMCDMMVAAATDHFYRDGGHVLDFINKGFEILDRIGWDKANEILPSLVGVLSRSQRSEELNRWQSPINLVALLNDAFDELESLSKQGEGKTWGGAEALTETLLGDDPHAIIDALKNAFAEGATLTQLTQTLTYAGAVRIARFHIKNEFNDWIAVLHTYSAANALHQCAKRAPSLELARGIFHNAMALYFDRWFNKPAARLPHEQRATETLSDNPDELLNGLVELLDTQAQVDEAGRMVYRYLSLGHPREALLERLGHVLLREDAEFHSFQTLEAAFSQSEELDEERARITLVGAARYLAAHAPTARALCQTANLALRLHRGEDLSAEDSDEDAE